MMYTFIEKMGVNMEKKSFIITVDTEGDNLWSNDEVITTKNSKYIPRFQQLCEKYNFKPVYLVNYEMVNDKYFVEFARDAIRRDACEIGMHLHGWNNPPYYKIKNVIEERPYLIEYPNNVMEEKIKEITICLEDTFNMDIVSHRAGRWAINKEYVEILSKYGYKIDCSVTPHINWSKNVGATGIKGPNYRSYIEKPSYLFNCILEVPMTIRRVRGIYSKSIKGILRDITIGKNLWMRPLNLEINEMEKIICVVLDDNNTDYIEFMIHSSELMPGGNIRFKSDNDIEYLYYNMEKVFSDVSTKFIGKTLREYSKDYLSK